MSSAPPIAAASPPPVAAAAGAAFLVLLVTLCGPIAPMGIAAALCGVLTLAWLVRAPRPGWPRTPVDLAALGWLAALLLATVFAVGGPQPGKGLGKGLMPALVGLAVLHTRQREHGRRALAVYLAAAGLAAAIGIALWVADGHTYAARARGLARHYMTFGGQLVLEIPVALGIALTARERTWRLGAAAVAAVALAALAVTFTRSAWLGVFVSCALLLAAVRPLGLVALGAVAVGAWAFAPGIWQKRLHSMFDPENGWNRERVLMWRAGLHMFRDHPVTGVGLRDLHAIYEVYRLPGTVEKVGHLHNVVVQIAATMGAVGLAAFAWLYGSLVRAASAGLAPGRGFAARLRREGLAAGVRLGVTAGLVGFLVTGAAEWNFGDEELLYQLYTLVGIAWASRGWEAGGDGD